MKKVLVLAVVLLAFIGCANNNGFLDDGKVHVVATVGMLGDMVENVGGEYVSVKTLMGPGVDPHLYQTSAGDIGLLEEADVIFAVGLHLEGKMLETFEGLKSSGKRVIFVGEELDESRLISADPEVFGGAYDPHIWFDVGFWGEATDVVGDVLEEVDPQNSEYYLNSTRDYSSQLEKLDIEIAKKLKEVPQEKKVLVTAHDAFGYFARAYGFEVHGIQGISTSSDYGLKDLEKLINLIVERQVKAIFVESSVSKKSIQALQEGVRAKGWEVEIGGQLFSDAMGKLGTEEGTYVGMVWHNVNTIVNSLR